MADLKHNLAHLAPTRRLTMPVRLARAFGALLFEQAQRMTGETHAREAAVSLWALLHGAETLEAGQVLAENRPASGFEFGLNAWLLLAETR